MSTLSNITTKVDGIKNNIMTCYNTLKTNLTKKGVSVDGADTLMTMAQKVDSIPSPTFKMVTGKAFTMDIEHTGGTIYEEYSFNHGLGTKPDRVIIKFENLYVGSFSKRSHNVVIDSYYHTNANDSNDGANVGSCFVSSPDQTYWIKIFVLEMNNKEVVLTFSCKGGTGVMYTPVVFTAIKY